VLGLDRHFRKTISSPVSYVGQSATQATQLMIMKLSALPLRRRGIEADGGN
jgi:hypothetical protein